MIQILGLRRFTPKGQTEEKIYDAFFDKDWRALSLKDLFENLPKYLDLIPESDRFNIFYTIASCGDGKREFKSLGALAFDFDGINTEKISEYTALAVAALGISPQTPAVVASGNGLHLLVPLKKPVTDARYFKTHKAHYKAMYFKACKAFEAAGLPIKPDTTVFESRRILRLPGTVNRKPDKADKMCALIQGLGEPVDFDLQALSGLPLVKDKEQLSAQIMRRYTKIDTKAVLSGCEFIKWARENPSEVIEPQWYAALSVTARLEDGEKISHELSAGHPGYSHSETQAKIDQALDASGPRTCDGINALWGKCSTCPNFRKVASPVLLMGDGTIPTESTGFHKIVYSQRGEKLVPCHEDLRKFFDREHNYKTIYGARQVYRWDGKCYKTMPDSAIESFAYEHFDPAVDGRDRREFRDLVSITHQNDVSWFEETTLRKTNFQNGYYDFERKDFLPHSPHIGFRTILNFDYDSKAKCPTYDSMLDKITSGDKATQDILNEVGGYVISGDRYWLHKAIILVGDGSNGKSTWLSILKAVVGEDNCSNLSMKDIGENYNTTLLDRRFLNISEETPNTVMVSGHIFKNLTSGGAITVREPYGKPYTILNRAKMLFSCNELPTSTDSSHGFFRRLLIIPFNYQFAPEDKDYDPKILEKLTQELPGIFNRFLAGYLRLAAQKSFSKSGAVDRIVAEYKGQVDSVGSWVRENIALHEVGMGKGKNVLISELYRHYLEEMRSTQQKAKDYFSFTKGLAKAIPDYYQRQKILAIPGEKERKKGRMLTSCDIVVGCGLRESSSSDARPGASLNP